MRETVPESFNLEKFTAKLTLTTEAYAKAWCLTFRRTFYSPQAAEQRELRDKLLDMCARALIETQGNPATMAEIDRILVKYQYGNGCPLFSADSASQFYKELSMKVAKK